MAMRKLVLIAVFAMASCSEAPKPQAVRLDKRTAELIAIDKMKMLANEVKDHKKLLRNPLVTDSSPEEGDGWLVSLSDGSCIYIIFVGPDGETDVTGSNAQCYEKSSLEENH
jgi:hypothetical protein